MNDRLNLNVPAACIKIGKAANKLGFAASCEDLTGNLLRTLVSLKPGARVLELGTGMGYSTAWLLDGMDSGSKLTSVELEAASSQVALKILGGDKRLTLIVADGGAWLTKAKGTRYDLIFADTWPGKYTHLKECLGLLAPNGVIVFDDLNPQPNWPQGHQSKVDALIKALDARKDLRTLKLDWASGIYVGVRRA